MEEQVKNEISLMVNELDESQLKVEKHAFDVINASDKNLNAVKEGIESVQEILDKISSCDRLTEQELSETDRIKDVLGKILETATSVNDESRKLEHRVAKQRDIVDRAEDVLVNFYNME